MFLDSIKMFLSLFTDGLLKKPRRIDKNKIQYTVDTKITVLHDQIIVFFTPNQEPVSVETTSYINRIIDELKIDFKNNAFKYQLLDQIVYELSRHANNKKEILKMVNQLFL
jgi:hypothetical protein